VKKASPRYQNIRDWEAVRASGVDPGPRAPSFSTGASLDPTERLLGEIAAGQPKVVPISDSQIEASAARDRRRKANKVLEDAGVRPTPWV
jgi:hypothetical protein